MLSTRSMAIVSRSNPVAMSGGGSVRAVSGCARAPLLTNTSAPKPRPVWVQSTAIAERMLTKVVIRPQSPAHLKPDQTAEHLTTTAQGPEVALPVAIQSFVDNEGWAASIVQLQQEVLGTVHREVEALTVQPTTYAADGKLHVPSADGKLQFNIGTFSGADAVATPLLVVEIGGTADSMLMSVFFTPRLCTLRHKDYTLKYWASTPPGTVQETFTEIHNRMQSRANDAGAVTASNHNGGASASTALYCHFHSPQLWSRLQAGHGALFQFNASDPAAMAAARMDVLDLVNLWCAWARSDLAGPPLPVHLQDECQDMTRIWTHALDTDEESNHVEQVLGCEATAKLKQTVSGDASLKSFSTW